MRLPQEASTCWIWVCVLQKEINCGKRRLFRASYHTHTHTHTPSCGWFSPEAASLSLREETEKMLCFFQEDPYITSFSLWRPPPSVASGWLHKHTTAVCLFACVFCSSIKPSWIRLSSFGLPTNISLVFLLDEAPADTSGAPSEIWFSRASLDFYCNFYWKESCTLLFNNIYIKYPQHK